MVGSEMSTESHLVMGKEKICFILLEKQKNSYGLCDHRTHCAFSLSVNILNSVQRHKRQSDTQKLWPWASIRWVHLVCDKTVIIMESNVTILTVFFLTSPTLLTFNFLPLFCENPAFQYVWWKKPKSSNAIH